MSKQSLNSIGFDNSLKIKNDANKNTRFINHIDSTVKPIKAIKVGDVKLSKIAYNCNGCKAGIVEEICDNSTIVIRGQFQRRNEWKDTPWTQEEINMVNNHHISESHRVHSETLIAIRGFKG